MNVLFSSVFIISCTILLFSEPDCILNTITSGATKGVNLAFNLIAVYAFMMGLLELMEKSSINKYIEKLLHPILKILFGKQDEQTYKQLAINLSSNMLGLGNASIPSGVRAMQLLDKNDGKIHKDSAMLFVLNSMSLQILPTTILSLRATNFSTNISCIVLPILIVSYITTILGVLLIKIFFRKEKYE